jgi:hypothetical protein
MIDNKTEEQAANTKQFCANKLILHSFLLFLFACCVSAEEGYSYIPSVDNVLSITTSSPPGILWLVDSYGRRTGADPELSVSDVGEQGGLLDGPLNEIPNSVSMQTNLGDDETGEPSPTTFWELDVNVLTEQEYLVNIKGIRVGCQRVGLAGLFASFGSKDIFKHVFVKTNEVRQLKVRINPDAHRVEVSRIVKYGDLLSDVETACQMKRVVGRARVGLMKKAAEIEDALERGRDVKAESLLWSFLRSLGEKRDKECADEDWHLEVKEPALTILREEAHILLEGVSDRQM